MTVLNTWHNYDKRCCVSILCCFVESKLNSWSRVVLQDAGIKSVMLCGNNCQYSEIHWFLSLCKMGTSLSDCDGSGVCVLKVTHKPQSFSQKNKLTTLSIA